MGQEASSSQEMTKVSVTRNQRLSESAEVSLHEVLDSLKTVEGDIGQICELTLEENRLVEAFFQSTLKLVKPLAATIPVSTAAFPQEMASVAQAHLDPAGHLVIQYGLGRVELRNLREECNRDLLIAVIKDVLPKFKRLTAAHRQKVESRFEMLSAITKEVQKLADALVRATTRSEHE
ncbi:MAG: hypothetical protein JSW72_09280 [Candidatus Bathyarchaeota archaeon]|nr:MAG: hypothetical protein JSW72_09280 [Candidatus Bathyarchaeota archaeon]